MEKLPLSTSVFKTEEVSRPCKRQLESYIHHCQALRNGLRRNSSALNLHFKRRAQFQLSDTIFFSLWAQMRISFLPTAIELETGMYVIHFTF